MSTPSDSQLINDRGGIAMTAVARSTACRASIDRIRASIGSPPIFPVFLVEEQNRAEYRLEPFHPEKIARLVVRLPIRWSGFQRACTAAYSRSEADVKREAPDAPRGVHR